MARKFTKKSPEVIERIIKKSFKSVGLDIESEKAQLLIRLIMSGIARHYFYNPDDLIDVGFLRFQKSPVKDELFTVVIKKDQSEGIINADTLWKYYTGELKQEEKFKQVLDSFLKELINYSQEQELNIMQLTSTLERKRRN